MTTRPDAGAVMRRVLAIVAVTTLLAAAVAALPGALAREPAPTRESRSIVPAAVAIAAEREPFLSAADDADEAAQRRPAHPRTLATYRALRAYPGAPPRVPHGLTTEEFRTSACRTCHERGGYVPRFNAYAPLTPHAELTDCLQCHTADDALVGTALPGADADDVCRQCHSALAAPPARDAAATQDAAWPRLAPRDGTPPPIAHELDMRTHCAACHVGPAAVAEIRARHAERDNCRQCHVTTEPDAGAFTRPPTAAGAWLP